MLSAKLLTLAAKVHLSDYLKSCGSRNSTEKQKMEVCTLCEDVTFIFFAQSSFKNFVDDLLLSGSISLIPHTLILQVQAPVALRAYGRESSLLCFSLHDVVAILLQLPSNNTYL